MKNRVHSVVLAVVAIVVAGGSLALASPNLLPGFLKTQVAPPDPVCGSFNGRSFEDDGFLNDPASDLCNPGEDINPTTTDPDDIVGDYNASWQCVDQFPGHTKSVSCGARICMYGLGSNQECKCSDGTNRTNGICNLGAGCNSDAECSDGIALCDLNIKPVQGGKNGSCRRKEPNECRNVGTPRFSTVTEGRVTGNKLTVTAFAVVGGSIPPDQINFLSFVDLYDGVNESPSRCDLKGNCTMEIELTDEIRAKGSVTAGSWACLFYNTTRSTDIHSCREEFTCVNSATVKIDIPRTDCGRQGQPPCGTAPTCPANCKGPEVAGNNGIASYTGKCTYQDGLGNIRQVEPSECPNLPVPVCPPETTANKPACTTAYPDAEPHAIRTDCYTGRCLNAQKEAQPLSCGICGNAGGYLCNAGTRCSSDSFPLGSCIDCNRPQATCKASGLVGFGALGTDGKPDGCTDAGDMKSFQCTTEAGNRARCSWTCFKSLTNRADCSAQRCDEGYVPVSGQCVPATTCTTANDCAEDGNSCTTKSCLGGACVQLPNQDQCTTGTGAPGHCSALSTCIADCRTAADCSDDNSCTNDTCSAVSGKCHNTPNSNSCTAGPGKEGICINSKCEEKLTCMTKCADIGAGKTTSCSGKVALGLCNDGTDANVRCAEYCNAGVLLPATCGFTGGPYATGAVMAATPQQICPDGYVKTTRSATTVAGNKVRVSWSCGLSPTTANSNGIATCDADQCAQGYAPEGSSCARVQSVNSTTAAGRVMVDAIPSTPIQGALVASGGVSVSTDSLGGFVLRNVPIGPATITVGATGYTGATIQVTLVAKGENEVNAIDTILLKSTTATNCRANILCGSGNPSNIGYACNATTKKETATWKCGTEQCGPEIQDVTCNGSLTQATNGRCSCALNNGETCQNANQCISNSCSGGKCVPASPSVACGYTNASLINAADFNINVTNLCAVGFLQGNVSSTGSGQQNKFTKSWVCTPTASLGSSPRMDCRVQVCSATSHKVGDACISNNTSLPCASNPACPNAYRFSASLPSNTACQIPEHSCPNAAGMACERSCTLSCLPGYAVPTGKSINTDGCQAISCTSTTQDSCAVNGTAENRLLCRNNKCECPAGATWNAGTSKCVSTPTCTPEAAHWGEWGEWSACTAGGSSQTRTRTCIAATCGGTPTTCPGGAAAGTETRSTELSNGCSCSQNSLNCESSFCSADGKCAPLPTPTDACQASTNRPGGCACDNNYQCGSGSSCVYRKWWELYNPPRYCD